jgi:hypothetical protein
MVNISASKTNPTVIDCAHLVAWEFAPDICGDVNRRTPRPRLKDLQSRHGLAHSHDHNSRREHPSTIKGNGTRALLVLLHAWWVQTKPQQRTVCTLQASMTAVSSPTSRPPNIVFNRASQVHDMARRLRFCKPRPAVGSDYASQP